jgi:ornithine decarboxylase
MEPYCLVDTAKITNAYKVWKEQLPEVSVFYAVKCNPHPFLLSHMYSLGIQFDCASKKEIEDVLRIAPSSTILYANPIKNPHHIKYACDHQIPILVVDCLSEMYKIKEIYPTCKLIIRLWVKNTPSSELSKKFGVSDELEYLLAKAHSFGLSVIGFSFHVGSGCEIPELYYEALQTCKHACDIAKMYDMKITTIDIGGGFQESNFNECAIEVRRGMKLFEDVQFISEVGRYLVESSHRLYVHVIGKKIKGNQSIYYLNDGVYGTFSCKIFDHAKPELKTDKIGLKWPSTLYGPTCDSLDIIEEMIWLPELEIGDCLYVDNYGAYTISSCFNGFEFTNFMYC